MSRYEPRPRPVRAPMPAATAQLPETAAPPSFESLYRLHYRRVFGLCRHLLKHADQAEDAAQEVFIRAYRAFGTYDRTQPFPKWISRIAGNYCIDVVRRRARERELFGRESDEVAEIPSGEPGALAELISDERATEIKAAIDALADKYRIPLVLAYFDESSYDDIADTLGITRNHVGTLILRGKQALRRSLAEARAPQTTGDDA